MRIDFVQLTRALNYLQQVKGQTYGNSWERRGEMGVLHNIFRKIDRIENIVTAHLLTGKFPTGDESLPETVADLAVYALLWMTRLSEVDEVGFKEWALKQSVLIKASNLTDAQKEDNEEALDAFIGRFSAL